VKLPSHDGEVRVAGVGAVADRFRCAVLRTIGEVLGDKKSNFGSADLDKTIQDVLGSSGDVRVPPPLSRLPWTCLYDTRPHILIVAV
jgi:hypothetical protein